MAHNLLILQVVATGKNAKNAELRYTGWVPAEAPALALAFAVRMAWLTK